MELIIPAMDYPPVPSIARYIQLSMAGTVLAITGFWLIATIKLTNIYGIARSALFALALAAVIGGCLLSLLAPARIRRGIRNHSWPQHTVERIRHFMEAPGWTVLSFVLIAVFAFFVFFGLSLAEHSRWHALDMVIGWSAFLINNTITGLRNSIRPTPPEIRNPFSGFRKVRSLRSSHWGDR